MATGVLLRDNDCEETFSQQSMILHKNKSIERKTEGILDHQSWARLEIGPI